MLRRSLGARNLARVYVLSAALAEHVLGPSGRNYLWCIDDQRNTARGDDSFIALRVRLAETMAGQSAK